MGVWGKAAYEHRQSQVLIEGVPQRVFGSFLTVQKGTRPTGRNPLRITYPCRHNPAVPYIQWK